MKRILNGKYVSKGYRFGCYEIRNHGYYPPDRCVWWEAININTGEADFHEKSLKDIRKRINELQQLKEFYERGN